MSILSLDFVEITIFYDRNNIYTLFHRILVCSCGIVLLFFFFLFWGKKKGDTLKKNNK